MVIWPLMTFLSQFLCILPLLNMEVLDSILNMVSVVMNFYISSCGDASLKALLINWQVFFFFQIQQLFLDAREDPS